MNTREKCVQCCTVMAGASLVGAVGLFAFATPSTGIFVGLWVPTLLLLAVLFKK